MRTYNPDANWWFYSIDSDKRKEKIRKNARSQTFELNPKTNGRFLLDYHRYMGLEKLLTCQTPGSRIPDERAFVITHQLFELVFKLMIFDLNVVAETFRELLRMNAQEFLRLSLRCKKTDQQFWSPALTASGRIKFSSKEVLPLLMSYLGRDKDKEEIFSSLEFYDFRKNLPPASGFQTAQFRLIQRAFGKSGLLSVRLFPGEDFRKNYGGGTDEPLKLVDKLILPRDAHVATPRGDSPLGLAAKVDDLAHEVLGKLPSLKRRRIQPIPKIPGDKVENAVKTLEGILHNQRLQAGQKANSKSAIDRDEEMLGVFRQDLSSAIESETARREQLQGARAGAAKLRDNAQKLHEKGRECYLALVLDRLVAADKALHAREDSFLSVHRKVAVARIRDVIAHAKKVPGDPVPPSGTGGGGVEYLGYSLTKLVDLFPALVAYRDIIL